MLEEIMEQLEINRFNLIVIKEPWLDDDQGWEINILEYLMFQKNRKNGTRDRGCRSAASTLVMKD